MARPTQSVFIRRIMYVSGSYPTITPKFYDSEYDSVIGDVLDEVLMYDPTYNIQGYKWDGTRQVLSTKAPNEVSGLTGWWEAFDATTLFTDAGVTPVSADGDAVYQINDKSGNNQPFVQSTLENRPLYKVNRQNGKSGLFFDGVDDGMVGPTWESVLSVGAKTIIVVVKIISSSSLEPVMNDSAGGYFLLSIGTWGGQPSLQMLNWDGTYDVTHGYLFTLNEAFVYSGSQRDGGLIEQINAGSISEPVPTGNTSTLYPEIFLFYSGGGFYLEGDFYALATWDVAISDEDRAYVSKYFMEKLGISQ